MMLPYLLRPELDRGVIGDEGSELVRELEAITLLGKMVMGLGRGVLWFEG